jgi:hypothetical protein
MKMNKTLAALAAASTLAFGGYALAQSAGGATGSDAPPPKSSTPGAGCTATGNAMSAGNLGGNATNKNCDSSNTTAATATTSSTAAAPAATTSPSSGSVATAPATSDTTTASSANTAPKRVARADRG